MGFFWVFWVGFLLPTLHKGGLGGAADPPRAGRAQEGRGQNQLGLRGKRRPTQRHCRQGLPGLFFGYVLSVPVLYKYKQTSLHSRNTFVLIVIW